MNDFDPENFKMPSSDIFKSFMSDSEEILNNFESIKGEKARILVQLLVMMTIQNIAITMMMRQGPVPAPSSLMKETQGALLMGCALIGDFDKETVDAVINLSQTICKKFFDARMKDKDKGDN